MHPSVVLSLSALLPAVAGHGIPLPRFLGGGRNVPSFSFPFDFHHHNHAVETPPTNSATPDPSGPAPVGPAPVGPDPVGPSTVGPAPEATIPARAVDGMCGPSYGSCPAGQCCSLSGYCGTGTPYCAAPDCQINFGPACDGNQKPSGADTSKIARPKNGNVLYGGVGIIDCVNNGEIAITFDDGPYLYTSQLLDALQANNVRATFFMTGNNLGKGMINDPSTPYPAIIKRMVANGHQIASHSWSHQNASALTTAQLTDQIIWNEIAFNSILGYFPTYWRPPYSICDTACSTLLAKYGYHVTYLDLDTMGYVYPNDMTIPKSLWDQAIAVPSTDNSWLQDEHDVVQKVVSTLVPYMLSTLAASGYTPVTLGQCLNDPPANWYRAGTGTVPPYTYKPYNPSATPSPTASPSSVRTTSTSTAAPSPVPTGSLKVSTTGQCSNGLTCQGSTFGNCCSVSGFCGTTAAYCGTGCQAAFGTCTTTTGGGTSVSTTGQCGNGLTCKGSTFGNCCSVNGWCGTTAAYCGTGCQAAFGTCT